MHKEFLILLAGFFTAFPRAAAAKSNAYDPSVGGGMTFTGGSGSYHKIAIYGDADWTAKVADPYGWTQFDSDNYVQEFSLGGGAWKDLSRDTRVKGGLGFTFGHIHNSDKSDSSFTLETGGERDFGRRTVGAEYRFTSGAVGGGSDINGNDRNIQDRFNAAHDRSPSATPQSYTFHEASAYAGIPVRKARLKLRLTLGLPSYDSAIVSETVGLRIPIAKPLLLTPALTFEEQRDMVRTYFSLSLYYLFR